MKRFNSRQTILFFYGFDFLLLLVLIICLLPFNKKVNKETVKSALLNSKYKEMVEEIVLEFPVDWNEEGKVKFIFNKAGTFWTGTEETIFGNYTMPLDNKTVENMISNFTTIVKMYKKSDNSRAFASYSLDEQSAVSVTFSDKNSEILSKIYFGKTDDFTNRIAFRSSSSDSVWEMDDKINLYLSNDFSFWTDPYLIPQCVSRLKGNLLENSLRRGKVVNVPEARAILKEDFIQKKTLGNGNSIEWKIYKTDSEYLLSPEFIPGPLNSEKEKQLMKQINYNFTVSQWTWEKFQEELKQL